MTEFWLAHLAFTLLAFLCISRWGRGLGVQSAKLLACALLGGLPVAGLSLALHLRTYTDDLAISSLVLLACAVLQRFGLPPAASRDRLLSLGLLFGLAVLLYPAALGLSYSDPYQLGYAPRPMLLVLGLLSLMLALGRCWLGAALLLLATLAFTLRLKASTNYWDYLLDPFLALYCLGVLARAAVHWLRARRPAFHSTITRNHP
ncbi:MAG: hypothetical protein KJ884_14485 [Gammaproteobacteria bacterium]|nr:hypothetical protein [Gammaproteobacteria bacterium]MBU1488267.1 hypothetical protein [Gammaproteobacteria bacterium]MBU2064929.1 hypothetical protein [Gammaproteobacteria bacterium]MBU2139550.1 hypothetical protein [Gammaproteobacteria bacterium]MBU2216542.1 hypothetical protein [Gammaproteobacteria bacterium]